MSAPFKEARDEVWARVYASVLAALMGGRANNLELDGPMLEAAAAAASEAAFQFDKHASMRTVFASADRSHDFHHFEHTEPPSTTAEGWPICRRCSFTAKQGPHIPHTP